jgi:hypothetical protein
MRLGFSIDFNSADDFIAHWASKYKYDERKYEENIGRPLTAESRRDLFEWKNGSIISARKLASIERNYPLTFDVGRVEERYLRPGTGGGAIWNIFYAHCLQPTAWPIFDQHVCRAMWYMRQGEFREIPGKDREKLRVYRDDFMPFHSSFGEVPERRLDKALFMFGKFLKTAKEYD